MKIANPAQLTNFLWKEKNKFPLTAIKGSVAKGFEVDQTQLFPWLMKFQQWLSDFNDEESKDESPTAAGDDTNWEQKAGEVALKWFKLHT